MTGTDQDQRLSRTKAGRLLLRASQPVQLIQILPVEQVAFERFNDLVHLPLGSVNILQQFLDAVPLRWAVKLAVLAFIKEFTMLLTDILFILLAMADFHGPSLGLHPAEAGLIVLSSSTPGQMLVPAKKIYFCKLS
jgi:hypothetical protein